MVNQDNVDRASDIGNTLQYGGSAVTVIAGLSLSEIGVIVGMIVAICGFVMNWIYKHKTYQLQVQRHQAEIEALKSGKISTLEEADDGEV
jgi:MFS-type transporter involved in bile tolerance (Atg22 family)